MCDCPVKVEVIRVAYRVWRLQAHHGRKFALLQKWCVIQQRELAILIVLWRAFVLVTCFRSRPRMLCVFQWTNSLMKRNVCTLGRQTLLLEAYGKLGLRFLLTENAFEGRYELEQIAPLCSRVQF